MPLVPIAIFLFVLLAIALALPFSLVQRYRMGTARRRARGWVATINLLALVFSCAFFFWIAALINIWAPRAFAYSLLGLLAGGLLGVLGLILTRWEETSRGLHYTPNRWLILLLTFAVVLRLVYGLWRAWHAWGGQGEETSWLAAAGIAGSLSVGAVLLGYYVAYTGGLLRRLRLQRRRQRSPRSLRMTK